MNAKQLLEKTTELALDLIERNGTFLPFCRCVNRVGEPFVYIFESDSEFTRDQAAESVRNSVQRDLEIRQLVGAAFCGHQKIRFSDSDGQVAAVKVELHYLDQPTMVYHFPYSADQISLQLMKYQISQSSEELFNG